MYLSRLTETDSLLLQGEGGRFLRGLLEAEPVDVGYSVPEVMIKQAGSVKAVELTSAAAPLQMCTRPSSTRRPSLSSGST